jgi:Tfp pilus assembly protein PilF
MMGRFAAVWVLALAGCASMPPAELAARGDRAMAARDWPDAIRWYAKASEGDASSESLLKLGQAQVEAGQLPAAAKTFGAALERDPKCERCYAMLGLVAIEDRQLTRAEQLLRNALHFDPSDVGARNNLGFVYLLRRDLPQAYECYLQSLAYAPNDAVANVNLGRLCRDFLHDVACARARFQRYLAVNPGGSEAVEIRAWLQAQEDRAWAEGPETESMPAESAPADPGSEPQAAVPVPSSATAGVSPASAAPQASQPTSAAPAPAAETRTQTDGGTEAAVHAESVEFTMTMAREWERKATQPLEVEVALRYARRAVELGGGEEAKALVKRLEARLAGAGVPTGSGTP